MVGDGLDAGLQQADGWPSDLITQAQAAELTGRTVHTIRRWRKEAGLDSYREPGNPIAPVQVSRAQLLALAGRFAPTKVSAVDVDVRDAAAGGSAGGVGAPDALLAQRDHIATLQSLVSSLSAQRDGLQARADQFRDDNRGLVAENQRLRSQVDDKQRRIDALETELASPVRALLGASRRFLGGK